VVYCVFLSCNDLIYVFFNWPHLIKLFVHTGVTFKYCLGVRKAFPKNWNSLGNFCIWWKNWTTSVISFEGTKTAARNCPFTNTELPRSFVGTSVLIHWELHQLECDSIVRFAFKLSMFCLEQCLPTGCIAHPSVYQNFPGVYQLHGVYQMCALRKQSHCLTYKDGFTHRPNRPWPRAPRFWGPSPILSYDDSILTKNLRNCAEA